MQRPGDCGPGRRPLAPRWSTTGTPEPERIQTAVIGAGLAGLSVRYHLKRRGLPFVILEANARVGDAGLSRRDSLHRFTPAGFDDLDGMPFAAKPFAFSTKDDMGDYLEVYAARFELPVCTGVGRSVAPGLPGDPSWHRGPWLACRRVRTAIRGLEDP